MYIDCRMWRQVGQFLTEMESEQYDHRYIVQTRSVLKMFVTHCYDAGIEAAGTVTVEAVKAFMRRFEGKSLSYQRGAWTAVRRFLIAQGNPACLKFRLRLRGTSRTRVTWLTDDECRELANLPMSPQESLLIMGCLAQCMRRVEVLRITRGDAEQALATNYLRTRGKTAERSVPLNPEYREVLTGYMALLEPTPGASPILPISRTRSEDILKSFRERHGLRGFAFHALRRSGLRRLYLHGVDLVTLARIAGHASTAQTEEYIGLVEDRVADAWARGRLVSMTSRP